MGWGGLRVCTVCAVIFVGFNVRNFHRLAAIRESSSLTNSADMYSTMAGKMMTSQIENGFDNFYTTGKFHSLASLVLLLPCAFFLSDVEYAFLLSPSPNVAACQIRRRLSSLAAAARAATMQKGASEYCMWLSEAH